MAAPPLEEQARTLSAEGRHAEAAELWARRAEQALQRRDRATAQQCHALAGEALRRDDRPAAAALHLQRALELLSPRDAAADSQRGAATASLVSAWADAGRLPEALDLLARALSSTRGPAARSLLLDGQIGLLLAAGQKEEARRALAELKRVAPAGAAPALLYRQASLDRLDGRLEAARAAHLGLLAQIGAHGAWLGPRAGAHHDLAELDLLEGRLAEALSGFQEASRCWTEAGRQAGAFRAEAGVVRAQLARGAAVVSGALSGPLSYAAERQMPLLEVELLLARGPARHRAHQSGAEADLDRAVSLCEAAGAVLLEGRARLARRECGLHRGDMTRARACLAADLVWLGRCPPE
jgi:tetratricopeptide (TPR) repeat protein